MELNHWPIQKRYENALSFTEGDLQLKRNLPSHEITVIFLHSLMKFRKGQNKSCPSSESPLERRQVPPHSFPAQEP